MGVVALGGCKQLGGALPSIAVGLGIFHLSFDIVAGGTFVLRYGRVIGGCPLSPTFPFSIVLQACHCFRLSVEKEVYLFVVTVRSAPWFIIVVGSYTFTDVFLAI